LWEVYNLEGPASCADAEVVGGPPTARGIESAVSLAAGKLLEK